MIPQNILNCMRPGFSRNDEFFMHLSLRPITPLHA